MHGPDVLLLQVKAAKHRRREKYDDLGTEAELKAKSYTGDLAFSFPFLIGLRVRMLIIYTLFLHRMAGHLDV